MWDVWAVALSAAVRVYMHVRGGQRGDGNLGQSYVVFAQSSSIRHANNIKGGAMR